MKHECGGEIDFVSIVNRGRDNSVDVLLMCSKCGKMEESIHYLYDSKNEDDTAERISKLVNAQIKTLNVRG